MKNKNKTTKFPVARIKRIMQKDEEVGKVAQATPVVISKALELFLAMIVEEASNVTVDRGSKRVEAYHLKHAIDTVDMLDFLKEIVEAVPDPSAGGTIDIEAENAERGKKRGKGKDKKGAADANGGEKPAPKRRRKKAVDKEKEEEEKEEEREMEVDEGREDDEDEGANGGGRSRRDDDDDEWEG
ncbi:histone-fold-containing protein [Trametes versicolor FP-101664 SS1]|uniref:histone-fold-containing protein n=1 Tax=Trametes versicolor (strain FP-101664) TaxID=717944 RepID=UPI0004624685|nr:histone-fold-containing protein [Trametes versicolor FP-101664 SS1]EIW52784.1 histone-fold-containing protein [Trametes versicolor FP-101664 SS1]